MHSIKLGRRHSPAITFIKRERRVRKVRRALRRFGTLTSKVDRFPAMQLGEHNPIILVADDEPIVVEVVRRYLRRDGFSVVTASTAPEAWDAARSTDDPPSLIVLDVMLPGGDGLDICRRLRNEGMRVPILLLTARTDEADRIAGLGIGADDYVPKPFSPGELVARVKAHLRRVQLDTAPPADEPALRGGDLWLDPRQRKVEALGVPVGLTAKEFDLLHFLMAHAGQTFSRDDLLDAVWDRDYIGGPSTVTVHIRRLREKIERDPALPTHIKVVWGVGYKFDPSA
jgi:two-component system, OmpR family, response regulator ResD